MTLQRTIEHHIVYLRQDIQDQSKSSKHYEYLPDLIRVGELHLSLNEACTLHRLPLMAGMPSES